MPRLFSSMKRLMDRPLTFTLRMCYRLLTR